MKTKTAHLRLFRIKTKRTKIKLTKIALLFLLNYTLCLSAIGSTFTSKITDISSTEISYTNSIPDLYIGLDYNPTLEDSDWVNAESTGFVQYNTSYSGKFTLPANIKETFPKMFFRLKVSASSIHDFENYHNTIPQFVESNYLDLNKIEKISKFRSGMGHDYSDDFESCRSMKHYFNPNVEDYSLLEIFSPVDGTVVSMVESNGIRISIKSSEHPEYQFVIFHIDPLSDLEIGDAVSAGQHIGNHINNSTISDIAVRRYVLHEGIFKNQLLSYFEVMTDEHFNANYLGTEIISRSDLIINLTERDANPLHCEGEEFFGEMHADGGYGSISNWAQLN